MSAEFLILLVILLWALGFFSGVGGGLVHILLVVVLALAILRLVQGRRV